MKHFLPFLFLFPFPALGSGQNTPHADDLYKKAMHMKDSVQRVNTGNYSPVIKALREVLSIDSNYYDAAFEIGLLYFIAKNMQAAKNEFERVVRLHPSHDKALTFLGIINYGWGDEQKGCGYFHKAMQLGKKEAADYSKQYCDHY